MQLSSYVIVYRNDEGDDELLEVLAYSQEQAVFLSSIESDRIISVTCTVARMAGGA